MPLSEHLRNAGIDESVTNEIMATPYAQSDDPRQDAANFYGAAMKRCEALLDHDTLAEVMYDRACCKTGARLRNARQFAKDHDGKPMEERVALLGGLRYMGAPWLDDDGDIETVGPWI